MNFFLRNRLFFLFVTAGLVLLLALFWPEQKKPGEMQKYYSKNQNQFVSLRYQGEMSFGDKEKIQADYEIAREENTVRPKEPLFRIGVQKLTSENTALQQRLNLLKGAKTFYASALVRSIVQDWSEPDYYYIIPYEPARDAEYGFKNCANLLQVRFKADEREFCIGTSSQGDTRRYLLDRKKNQVVIAPDFTVRRVLNNILAQRDQSLHPYGADSFDAIELQIAPEMLQTLPLLREKTGGKMTFRMLVKDDGKSKVNVWHVENLLSIRPSHAAEYAQLVAAMRISAPFALPAQNADLPQRDLLNLSGLSAKQTPVFSGAIKLRKTDKQDVLLTRYAFFPPGVKPLPQPAIQSENALVRPLDTLAVSNQNSGFITADLFPRFKAILIKFENDLKDAQQTGQKEKSLKENRALKQPKP